MWFHPTFKNKLYMVEMKVIFFFLILAVFSVGSCNNSSEKKVIRHKPGKDELADINSYFVQKDRERIQNYIERKNLAMKESESGLWYTITREGTGNLFRDDDKITFNFDCSLLDGTKCYSSETSGSKEYVLGKGEIEAGLNEGLRMLKPGSEAIFILPPFLAYGLVGDGKSIPSRATIVYYVKILNKK
jgi:FKBP-type peptidyl-prolyl cis-trans isomerase FkpA